MTKGTGRTIRALAVLAIAGATLPFASAAPTFGKMEKGKPFSGGFRMEGAPKVDDLFGDTLAFTEKVDRYLALYDAMQRVRDQFSRSVQTVLTTLAAQPSAAKGSCPESAIALGYARSFHLGQDFQRSGGELERLFAEIRDLDKLGETGGLTPDYRWKVRRALTLHKEVLVDWNEMKAFFYEQLAQELAFHKCDPKTLMEKGEAAGALAATDAVPALPARSEPKKSSRKPEKEAPPPLAATASFTVDNTGCDTPIRLYLDGQLVGPIAGKLRTTFTTLVGPHDMCLIPDASPQRCGDLGTVRRTYIHQGWTIQLRCAK